MYAPMKPNRRRAAQANMRLADEDKALLKALSDFYGLSMNDVVMLLVRKDAVKHGVTVPPLTHTPR